MQITRLLNSNCFPGANKPRFVILHGTAGGTSAQAIAQYFQGAGVSAHYVIGVQGEIYQCNNEQDGAWADGIIDGIPTAGLPFRTQSDEIHRDDWWDSNGINPNDQGIAIEHCKPHNDNSDVLTPAQQASSLWLVNDICNRWNIPKRFADANGGITGHFSIAAKSRQRCPGPYPWQELFNYLNGENMSQIDLTNPAVASHFSGGPDVWQCKDKDHDFIVGHGILAFYRKFGGDALCGLTYLGLPRSNETVVLNKEGTTIGAIYQRFERGVLAYDPVHKIDNPPGSGDVYLLHIDSGLGQDPRIALLQAQVAQLQAANADLHEKLAELQADALAQENAALQAKIAQAVKDLS